MEPPAPKKLLDQVRPATLRAAFPHQRTDVCRAVMSCVYACSQEPSLPPLAFPHPRNGWAECLANLRYDSTHAPKLRPDTALVRSLARWCITCSSIRLPIWTLGRTHMNKSTGSENWRTSNAKPPSWVLSSPRMNSHRCRSPHEGRDRKSDDGFLIAVCD